MDWVRYSNQGATRSLPLDEQLIQAMGFLPELGLAMDVFSGGQPAAGGGPRVGSVRHDHGNAADVFFYQGDRRLDWANPQDLPLYEEIVRRARANGVTGFGAGPGYMQPGSMHIGFGNPGVWGAGGSGANAPDWLRSAFEGAPAGQAPALSFGNAAPAGGTMAPGATSPAGMAAMPPLDMGVPVDPLVSMFVNPSQAQTTQQVAQAAQRQQDQQRRQALYADVGRWFG